MKMKMKISKRCCWWNLALTLLFLFSQSPTTQAGISSNFTLTSDYVYRGQTQTNHGPAVQGGFEFSHEMGLTLGVWASNVAIAGGAENDVYLKFVHSLNKDYNVGIEALWYNYPLNNINLHGRSPNTMEFNVNTSWKMLTLAIHYTQDSFGTGSNSWYYVLGGEFEIPLDFTLELSLGATTYEDELKAGKTDFYDYLISLARGHEGMMVALNWSDTNRKTKTATAETKVKDDALSISISKSF